MGVCGHTLHLTNVAGFILLSIVAALVIRHTVKYNKTQ